MHLGKSKHFQEDTRPTRTSVPQMAMINRLHSRQTQFSKPNILKIHKNPNHPGKQNLQSRTF